MSTDVTLAEVVAHLTYDERIAILLDRHPHDIEWLEIALQAAVSVEFATIPPYLCALWSIHDPLDEVAQSIRNIAQEEMLHMSLASNMLTAIGGSPAINDPKMVPTYPGKIPGAVHPELVVSLSGLSRESVSAFAAIESPTDPEARPNDDDDERGFKTIGLFYDAILAAFHDIGPELYPDRQVSGPLAYLVMHDMGSIEFAINLIKDQGEGSNTARVEGTEELAHYYRFREILEGRQYTGMGADRQPEFDGPEVPWPEAWPMAQVPEGGYRQDDPDVSPEVWRLISDFDHGFTQVLNRLQSVWEFGDQGALINAIETMFSLSETARTLMAHEIPSRPGENFGPCFRAV